MDLDASTLSSITLTISYILWNIFLTAQEYIDRSRRGFGGRSRGRGRGGRIGKSRGYGLNRQEMVRVAGAAGSAAGTAAAMELNEMYVLVPIAH